MLSCQQISLKTSLILHSVSLLLERKTKMLKKKMIFVTTVQNNGSNFDMTQLSAFECVTCYTPSVT